MIKTMWILTFREDLDRDEVSRWWRSSHGELALRVPGIKRYVQNHYIPASGTVEGAAAGLGYQGVVECWFEDQASFDAAMASPEWADLESDGFAGLNMTRLQGGFVREHVMRWEALGDGRVYTTTDEIPDPAAPGAEGPAPLPMIKAMWLLKFRNDVDHEEIRRHWRTSHGQIALRVPGIRRYVQNHILDPLDEERAEAGIEFHGVVECWFDDYAAFETATTSPEWELLRADEGPVFDSGAFQGGFVREYVMRWEGLPPGPTLTTTGDVPS